MRDNPGGLPGAASTTVLQVKEMELSDDDDDAIAVASANISTRIGDAGWSNEPHHDSVEHIYENYEKY
jgi:hypothetical protein